MPGPLAFDEYDSFVRSLGFLSGKEACTLIVAGDEILDNLLTHGEIGPAGVVVLVRKRRSGLTLGFFVESHPNFAAFAETIDNQPAPPPRYNPDQRRWRGLGLTMCRTIAPSIQHRPGLLVDRIIMTIDIH